ncbi:MAG: hypothetical protein HY917_03595 [Candidatus Diapherotrites archaeon]|nr:hypothetical protein [Candidatus Diapherotrites archaeon]
MNAAYREPFTITYYPIMSGKQLSPRQTKVTFSTETKTVSRVEITQYASEVRAGETGSYAVELHNNTAGSISLEVTLTAFKGKLFASPQTITLQPNETRFVRIPFQVQGFSDGRIEAELSVRGNAVSAQRTVTFVPVFGEESSRTQPGTTPVPLTRGEVQTPSWWQQAGITLLGMLKAG